MTSCACVLMCNRELLHAGIRPVSGCELSEMSFLAFLWYVKSAGSMEQLVCTVRACDSLHFTSRARSTPGAARKVRLHHAHTHQRHIATDRKLKGGAYQMSTILADRIGHDRIRLRSPARAVVQDAHGVTVTCEGGGTVRAKYAIVAAPPQIASSLHFQPPLPAKKLRLMQNSLCGGSM